MSYTLVNDISYAWRQINTLFALLKDQLTVKSTNSDGYEFTTQFTPLTGTVFSLAVKFGTILGASHATNVLDSFKSTFTYDSISTSDVVFACSAVINGEAAEEILRLTTLQKLRVVIHNPQHKANGLSALRLCVWLCDNCGIELFYADYYGSILFLGVNKN